MLYDNLTINAVGHLEIAGQDAVLLAQEYGDPVWLMDEDKLRRNMRSYVRAMEKYFGVGAKPLYAGKASSFKTMYKILQEEGMYADCSSPGEIYTALAAGFPAEHIYFHGNNKTDEDIRFALEKNVGYFIVDNFEELNQLNQFAAEYDKKQNILLRLTPGTKVDTMEKINTGRLDVQFGVPIYEHLAHHFVKEALDGECLNLKGFHFHIGSQITDPEVYVETFRTVLGFAQEIRETYHYTMEVLDIGGGFGVQYVVSDQAMSVEEGICTLAQSLDTILAEYTYPKPQILMEPGRSIVADTTVTIYRVGTVKEIPGVRNYVTVNGGMTDNPRYALYESNYTVYLANRMEDEADFLCTLAGRCCESGDILQKDIHLPKPVRGDYVAVLGTGAYNFSMASNYNRLPRPALVLLSQGTHRLAVRRESYEDLIGQDI